MAALAYPPDVPLEGQPVALAVALQTVGVLHAVGTRVLPVPGAGVRLPPGKVEELVVVHAAPVLHVKAADQGVGQRVKQIRRFRVVDLVNAVEKEGQQ